MGMLAQMGPYVSFLPPMGFSVSETVTSKASLRYDCLSNCLASAAPLSPWRVLCPPAAALSTVPVVSGAHRKQSAYCANVGKGLGANVTARQVQNSRNAAFERHNVRSLVDEATAHSSDVEEELKASRSTSERNDATAEGDSRGFELQVEEMDTGGGQQFGEEETSNGNDGRDEEFGAGIATVEASPSPIEMDYEDIKLEKERNWNIADLKKLDILRSFEYRVETGKGSLIIQALKAEHMKAVEEILVDSFAELMGGLLTYRPLLKLTVKQYVRERYACLPNAVTLVGLYAPAEDDPDVDDSNDNGTRNWLLAGTVELSFSDAGHPDIPGGLSPPPGSPYLCNMAVSTAYRRRGIGRQMLKAAEALAESQGCQDIYLHCRMVDRAPLIMYKGASYEIVDTDSFLSLLSFQRRRYLMKKVLHPASPSVNEENTTTAST